jgi:hypothetical protein
MYRYQYGTIVRQFLEYKGKDMVGIYFLLIFFYIYYYAMER